MNPETLISRFIISEHFGNIVNKVCALLLAKGRLPFNSILSETKLPSQTIRSTLSILLQVGVVKYALADVGTRSITYYSALYLPILYRIRYHKYISITETIFSNTEADIISHLLVNGHSSLSVLLDLFPDRNSFEVLLKAKLIIQITPTSTLSTIDVVLQEEAKAFAEVGVPLSTLEKKKLRKRIADERDQEAQELAPARKKIVRDFDEMNSTVQDVRLNDLTVSWTVNFDQFHTRMRDLEIVSLVEHLINPTAAEIVRVMLSHDESLRLFTDQMSREISISRIKEAIDPIFKFRVEFAEVEPLLEYLGALQSEHFVTKIDDYSGVLYAVEIGKIVTTLKTRIIENIISERFGDNATRIWRVLKTNGKLDDKQISKFALIDPQKVRELLYKMLSFNLVFMQDVPKTNDHSSSRTVFLWDVSMEKCIANVLGECYSAMANLKARFIHENDVNSVLLSKMARTDVKEDFDILEEVEKKSWDDLCRNKDLINGSIDEIDRTVFILRDL